MSANYKQLSEFQKNIEKLNTTQKEEFLESCTKELAARLLAKVIKRTPVDTGTLRRGWTKEIKIRHEGNQYIIDIVNPTEYASYIEYGHRTKNGKGWKDGTFMLTLSEAEIRNSSDKIIQAKLKMFLEKVFE